MADYRQPPYIDRRLRYFNGQFLKEQDFIDEQRYHLDRRRRLTRLLMTPGVLEGLDVTPVPNAPRVKVAQGTAVDAAGRLLVRSDDSVPIELGDKVNHDGPVTVIIAIAYDEVEADAPQGGGSPRWLEAPDVVAFLEGDQNAPAPDTHLHLARLTLDANGAVTIDPATPAGRAGLSVRGRLAVTGPATFSDGIAGAGAPLRIDGDAQLRGPVDFDSSVRLLVTNGSNDFGRTNLVLSGRLQDSNDAWNFGSGGRNSIVFATNASASHQNVGAVGDEQQSIQLEGNSGSLGFLTRLRGSNPALVIRQDGNIGVGTPNPAVALDVAGDLSVSGGVTGGQVGRWTVAGNLSYFDIHIAAGSDYNVICAQRNDGSPITVIRVFPAAGALDEWVGRFIGLAAGQTIQGEVGIMVPDYERGALNGNLQGHPLPNNAIPTRFLLEVRRVHAF
jgi:hypothetical protein